MLAIAALGAPEVRAQFASGYVIQGKVVDGEFPNAPRFEGPPIVEIVIVRGRELSESLDPLHNNLMDLRERDNRYVFKEELFPLVRYAGTYAFFIAEANGGDYILREGDWKRVLLASDVSSTGDVPVTLKLFPKSRIADAHRRESLAALRGDPGTEEFERAYQAARSAIDYDPTIDNYLNLFDILKKAIRSGYYGLVEDFYQVGDLEALRGFGDFSFVQQWRLMTELLITLSRIDERDTPVGFGSTAGSAAISVGEHMVTLLEDGADYRALPVIQVFQALERGYWADRDCGALIRSNARALELADEASMNWGTQRGFLRSWGDCLHRRSGYGDGRLEERFLDETAADPGLAESWREYFEAADRRVAEFRFPTGDADELMKEYHARAGEIVERSGV